MSRFDFGKIIKTFWLLLKYREKKQFQYKFNYAIEVFDDGINLQQNDKKNIFYGRHQTK